MNAVDTNVLVYSVSADEPVRGPRAAALLQELSASNTVLLWQVAYEFGAVVSRLHQRGRVPPEAFDALVALRNRFPLILPTSRVLDHGLQLLREQKIAYWDAMLLAACLDADVTRIYSEDVPGTRVGDLEIVNPFANAR